MGKTLEVRLTQVNMVSNLGLALMAAAIVFVGIVYSLSAASKPVPCILYISAIAIGVIGAFIFVYGYCLANSILKDSSIQ